MLDVFVIGGGPGGYHAALSAKDAGLTVALAEQADVGGVCLNEGCIPSKTLLKAAKVLSGAKTATQYGVNAEGVSIDMVKLNKRKNKIIKILKAGVSQKLNEAGITCYATRAKIATRTATHFVVSVGETDVEAKNVIIASGSKPLLPPIPGLEMQIQAGKAVTNREILNLTVAPEHLIIVGGGVIGLEMADFYVSAGSKVTVIEMLDEVGGASLDAEAATILRQALAKAGVSFKLQTKVTSFLDNGVEILEPNGETSTIEADLVLVSIGRQANSQDLGLEELGVKCTRDKIDVDSKGQTNIAGLYAIGDVTGQLMLAHTAYHAAEVAVSAIAKPEGEECLAIDTIPSVIYTHPEVASVGLTAKSAEAMGRDVLVTSIPFNYSGRYLAETEREASLCKMISDKQTGVCLGVTLVGPYASEIIMTATLFVTEKFTVAKIAKQVFPHPSVVELLKAVAEKAHRELEV